ncbi:MULTISPECIES: hypothetical protein [Bacillus]|uniref:Uncharacterized protein n=1 Tax=Bacillus capparidis TaxID=1840411 RepID=A0ABS4CVI1_9BACI|nr:MULTISPECIES: hypothetical protein [Bacillus]MBP1081590.1 hypothetical protein [Bacillus capparidis]MED1096250.1 hypothetical protein [Bacillus capparidis]
MGKAGFLDGDKAPGYYGIGQKIAYAGFMQPIDQAVYRQYL